MELLLQNITWWNGTEKITGDIRILKNVIGETGKLQPKKNETTIDFTGHFIYPGLINAHDHLEMNLYSRLGKPGYNNYIEWSSEIYKPETSPVKEIEKVDIKDRLLWGALKNLVSGATTVVHHNPWHRSFGQPEFPVRVLKQMNWAHSLAFGGDVKSKFKDGVPFVIHAAEGVDDVAFSELSKLDSIGLLQENTVLIHCIAIEQDATGKFYNGKFSVVWCPESNMFMFGRTAPVEKMKDKIRVAIGTDSMMTGSATLLDEMRASEKTHKVTSVEIMNMVTRNAAAIFNLPVPEIQTGRPADLFIVKAGVDDYVQNLLTVNPSDIVLVMVNGNIRLQNASIENKSWKSVKYMVTIGGALKKTDVDVASLKKRIGKYVPKDILEKNPLWNLIEA